MQNLKLLVVDDNVELRDLLKKYFNSIGINIELASNGVEALKKTSAKKYDLILTDINMPKMGGVELIKYIKGDSSQTINYTTPIIAFSARVDDIRSEAVIVKNKIKCFSKPFNLTEISTHIEKTIGFSQSI